MDDKTLEKLIESGEIGTMTECAYGSAIADTESEKLKKDDSKDKKD